MKTNEAALESIGSLTEEREASTAPRAEPAGTFHTAMAVAFLLIAFAGFAPTYYLKGVTQAPPLSPLVHVHGLVFTGWLLLLLTQSRLVAARRVDLHRRLGMLGAALATTMVPMGLMTAVDAARRGVATPGLLPQEFLIFPVGQILMFGAFVGVALLRRRCSLVHRRMILMATVTIMTPAIARLPFVGERPGVALLLSTLFVVAGMLHDLRSRRRVHPVYVVGGLLILASGPVRFALAHTSAWQSFARFLME